MKGNRNLFAFLLVVLVSAFCFVNVVKADGEVNVTSFEELQALQTVGGSAKLQADITMTDDIRFREDLVLDLNGHEINTNVGYTLIVLSNVTFKDTAATPGKITNGSLEGDYVGGTDWQAIQVGTTGTAGMLTIESGNYEAKYIFHMADGKLVINGGTLNATSLYAIGTTNSGNAEVEINGGTINYSGEYQAINNHASKVTMNGGTINSPAGYGITVWKDAEVIVNGGTIEAYSFAISGNGSQSGTNEGTNAKITVTGGTLKSNNATAIYAPQVNGVTVISGGTLTGKDSAVEVRAGKLTVTGGTLKGNVDENGVVSNNNGSTTTGAAVAVSQHTTKQPIEVNISGGTFNGYVAVSEANPEGNSDEDIANVVVNITGGTFNTASNATIISEDNNVFVTGGTFKTSVAEFVKEGYAEKAESNMLAVYKVRNITLNAVTNGTATLSKTTGLKGDEVKLTITPADEYVLDSIKVLDSENHEVEVKNNAFVMPDDDVTVTVKFIKVVTHIVDTDKEVTEVTIGITNGEEVQGLLIEGLHNDEALLAKTEGKDATVELKVEELVLSDDQKKEILSSLDGKDVQVLGFYDISIMVNDKDGNELGKVNELSKEIEIVIMLPKNLQGVKEGYNRTFYVVREHEGKLELLKGTLSEDGTYVTVKTNKFSTYALAYEDTAVVAETPATVTNPKTGDNILIFTSLGLLSVLGFAGLAKKKKLS